MFTKWLKDESGQAMSEYGLLLALVVVAVVGVVAAFGTKIKDIFTAATSAIS